MFPYQGRSHFHLCNQITWHKSTDPCCIFLEQNAEKSLRWVFWVYIAMPTASQERCLASASCCFYLRSRKHFENRNNQLIAPVDGKKSFTTCDLERQANMSWITHGGAGILPSTTSYTLMSLSFNLLQYQPSNKGSTANKHKESSMLTLPVVSSCAWSNWKRINIRICAYEYQGRYL